MKKISDDVQDIMASAIFILTCATREVECSDEARGLCVDIAKKLIPYDEHFGTNIVERLSGLIIDDLCERLEVTL